jgi:hypothetical protein
LLADGRVLVAGGRLDSPLVKLRTAELYDPVTETWALTGSLNQERNSFTLTLLPDGKVLAAGGLGTNGAVGTVELYDPATGAWAPTGSLQAKRAWHTATLLRSGTVLVAGGSDVAADTAAGIPIDPVVSTAEIYDPATGTWSPAGAMNQPRQLHTATLMPDGKVLVAGGVRFFDSLFPTAAELYDPVANAWSPTLPLTSGRRDHIAALLPSGQVLVAGGFNSTDTGASAELYDSASLVPAPVLLLQPAKTPTGDLRFSFQSTPGLSFTILSATSLAQPVSLWTTLGIATESSPGRYEFTDPTSPQPLRFYRVLLR